MRVRVPLLVSLGLLAAVALLQAPSRRVQPKVDARQFAQQQTLPSLPQGRAAPGLKTPRQAATAYGHLPLGFEANRGQTDPQVAFLARGRGSTLFLTATEAVLALRRSPSAPPQRSRVAMPTRASGVTSSVVRLRLLGANPAPRLTAVDPLPGRSNYFLGNNPKEWRTNLPQYRRVRYENVYPGIDLVFYGNQGQLEYDFIVAPGADPRVIRLQFDGPDDLRLDSHGNLIARLGQAESELQMLKPRIYQPTGDNLDGVPATSPVEGSLLLQGDHEVGFAVGAYDSSRPLVIDPALAYSTYLGGSGNDEGHGIAVDAAGSAYVIGRTPSANFPTASPLQGANAGGSDVFVLKLNPAGSALVYSTYLGGSADDFGAAIAVDAAGNAYLTGNTLSNNFPAVNAVQASPGGGSDAFVAKLSATGSALLYSTYLGGSGADSGNAIAVGGGNAYVIGNTASTNFPTAGPLQSFGGVQDAFVTKLNPAGNALVYSTYLGGAASDFGAAIAVDAAGNAYLAGYTLSFNFPLQNPLQSTRRTSNDGFVSKLNPAGSALVYSTYLGGNDDDYIDGIALDAAGNAVVTGETRSTTFPTQNAFDTDIGYGSCGFTIPGFSSWWQCSDAFVSKLNAAGSALLFSTYLGGSANYVGPNSAGNFSGEDFGTGVAVDSLGNIYVTGTTQSTSDFPIANSFQSVYGGSVDSYVAKFTPDGALMYSSYLGGSGDDSANSIAVDSAGSAYVTGYTESPNFPTLNPLQPACNACTSSSADAFVTKISEPQGANPVPHILSLSPTDVLPGGPGFTLTVDGLGFVPASVVRWNNSDRFTTFVSSTRLTAAILAGDLPNYAAVPVSVFSPSPGGGLTVAYFRVTNPVPTLASLSPTSALPGSPDLTLTVNGTGFRTGSVVRMNAMDRPTTFVSDTRLTATITSNFLSFPASQSVTVFNPSPGGGLSSALTFTVTDYPVPVLTSLSPGVVAPGSPGFILTVTGTGFVSTSLVRWNGSSRATTFVSSTQLTAAITAADIATAGSALVNVRTGTMTSGTSNSVTFYITAGNTLPLAQARYWPHIVSGGGYVTKMTITNLVATPNNVLVYYVDPQAGTTLYTRAFTLPPAGTVRYDTGEANRNGNMAWRWALCNTQANVAINLFFEVMDGNGNVINTVGFNEAPPLSDFTVPVELEPATVNSPIGRTVGVALANPNNTAATVTLKLIDSGGTVLATTTLNIPAMAQTIASLQVIPAFAAVLPNGNFVGSVAFSSNVPITAISLMDDLGLFSAMPPTAGRAR